MILFPLGTISAGSNTGTIDSISYSFFEPNKNKNSQIVHTTLVSKYQNQTRQVRKKALPYLMLSYEYSNIFESEYNQLEHFVYSVEDGNTPFYIVDLKQPKLPSNIDVTSDPTWVISISNTRLFSSVSKQKANYVFVYNGNNWKLGSVTAVSANTSVTISVSEGALTTTQAVVLTGNAKVLIYPVYEVYLAPNSLNSFKVTNFWDTEDGNRGTMHSGGLNFISRYKV